MPALTAYETPLGRIEVNREAVRDARFPHGPAAGSPTTRSTTSFPSCSASPRTRGWSRCSSVSWGPKNSPWPPGKLAARLKQGDVIVASSDLTHYGEAYQYTPFPADANCPRGFASARARSSIASDRSRRRNSNR